MNLRWVKIRSWHAVKGERILGVWKTRCGRYALGNTVEELPKEGKSCESCTRIVLWLQKQ